MGASTSNARSEQLLGIVSFDDEATGSGADLLAYHDRKRDEFMAHSEMRVADGREYQFVSTDSLLWQGAWSAQSAVGGRRRRPEPPMLVFALWLHGLSVADATAHRRLRAQLIASVRAGATMLTPRSTAASLDVVESGAASQPLAPTDAAAVLRAVFASESESGRCCGIVDLQSLVRADDLLTLDARYGRMLAADTLDQFSIFEQLRPAMHEPWRIERAMTHRLTPAVVTALASGYHEVSGSVVRELCSCRISRLRRKDCSGGRLRRELSAIARKANAHPRSCARQIKNLRRVLHLLVETRDVSSAASLGDLSARAHASSAAAEAAAANAGGEALRERCAGAAAADGATAVGARGDARGGARSGARGGVRGDGDDTKRARRRQKRRHHHRRGRGNSRSRSRRLADAAAAAESAEAASRTAAQRARRAVDEHESFACALSVRDHLPFVLLCCKTFA